MAVILASRQYPRGGEFTWIGMDIYGCRVVLGLFTLTFDSSPIKGEGILSVIADLIRNPEVRPGGRHSRVGGNPQGAGVWRFVRIRICRIGTMRCVSFPLLHPVDSRLRGNDGVVWLSCCLPVPGPSPLDCGSSPQ